MLIRSQQACGVFAQLLRNLGFTDQERSVDAVSLKALVAQTNAGRLTTGRLERILAT